MDYVPNGPRAVPTAIPQARDATRSRCSYGNSALHFTRISNYAVQRLALFVAKRHKRASGYGLSVVVYMSPNRMGLVTLE